MNGQRTGQGTYTWADGNKYVGDFLNGKKIGQGTFTWKNGNKYVGEWRDDKRTGQGTFTWAVGDKYVGEWRDDKRTGQGTYTWKNGNSWTGQWSNDIRIQETEKELNKEKIKNEEREKEFFSSKESKNLNKGIEIFNSIQPNFLTQSNKMSYFNAIKYFDKVISLNPSNSDAFFYRGLSRDGLKNYFGGYTREEYIYLSCYDLKNAVRLSPRKYKNIQSWLNQNGNKNQFGSGKWCKNEKLFNGLIN